MGAAVRSGASGGATQRDHLEQLCFQTGKTPEELGVELQDGTPDTPDIPDGGEFLWGAFWDLSFSRSFNAFTENPLPWLEIQAYAALNSLELTPFEASTLHGMDQAYLTARAEMAAEAEKKRKK